MLKTWNLSSTLTTQTTLRTISTVSAEQPVAKRQGPLIPSSPITMWDRRVTSSLCSEKPTRQSTQSSYKWWKTEEVSFVQTLCNCWCSLLLRQFKSINLLVLIAGRRGFRDDRRDRYGRRDFGGFRDRDNNRGFDNKSFGANSQNGGYGAANGTNNGFTGYGNGQSAFTNPAAAFPVQSNFQAQNGAQPAAAHAAFAFPQTQAPPQHPTPLVPYSMPPQFTQ